LQDCIGSIKYWQSEACSININDEKIHELNRTVHERNSEEKVKTTNNNIDWICSLVVDKVFGKSNNTYKQDEGHVKHLYNVIYCHI
jgi:hypothetical protein